MVPITGPHNMGSIGTAVSQRCRSHVLKQSGSCNGVERHGDVVHLGHASWRQGSCIDAVYPVNVATGSMGYDSQ